MKRKTRSAKAGSQEGGGEEETTNLEEEESPAAEDTSGDKVDETTEDNESDLVATSEDVDNNEKLSINNDDPDATATGNIVEDKEEENYNAADCEDASKGVEECTTDDIVEDNDVCKTTKESNVMGSVHKDKDSSQSRLDKEDVVNEIEEATIDQKEEENEASESNTKEGEASSVQENPLFNTSISIDNLAPDEAEELDFEPDIDDSASETETSGKKDDGETPTDKSNWLDNAVSPSKVPEDVEEIVLLSDTEDIDELGDKIDAACPSKAELEDDESDDEKRGWRSEKKSDGSSPPDKSGKGSNRNASRQKRPLPRRSPPRRSLPKRPSPKRRRISPPRSRVPKSRNRSSSIEILCERSLSKSPPPRRGRRRERSVDRLSLLSNGRFISRSRSRSGGRYSRQRSASPGDTLAELRQARDRTDRIVGARRQVEDLRDKVMGDRGGMRRQVKDRLGQVEEGSQPRKKSPEPIGFKLVVKNFPPTMSESEFYSMFIRKGEIHTCEMKKQVGHVTYKTRVSAENAKKTLDGTKNGSHTLSVKDAPYERPRPSAVREHRPEAPPPPTGIFNRLGHQQSHQDRSDREQRPSRNNVFDRLEGSHQSGRGSSRHVERDFTDKWDDNFGVRGQEEKFMREDSRQLGGMSGGMGGGMAGGMGVSTAGVMGVGMSGGIGGGMSGGMGALSN